MSWTVGERPERLCTQQLGEKISYFCAVDTAGPVEGIVPTRRLMSDPHAPIASPIFCFNLAGWVL